MTSLELAYKNEAKFFVFERCILYTTVVRRDCSYSYENHFWMKDVTFNVTLNNKMFAELENCNHKINVDNEQLLSLMVELKVKHKQDEITAEIDMSDGELIRLIDSLEGAKIWRRQSLVSLGDARIF